jgi:hypothetical protein
MDRPRAELFVAGPANAAEWPRRVAAFWPRAPDQPSCLVAPLAGDGLLLGRYSAPQAGAQGRRATGGRPVRVADGNLGVAIALPRTGLLLAGGRDVAPVKIVNRFVRPILGALANLGHAAGYFGRDFVSVSREPVAWVSFDASREGAALLEAIVVLAGAPPVERFLSALHRGFEERLGAELGQPRPAPDPAEPAWPPADELLPPRASAPREIPIGTVEARVELDQLASRRRGVPVIARARLLGDFQADAPSVEALEASLSGCPATFEEVGKRVDAQFGPGGTGTIVGLRTLKPIAEAILEAAA